MTFNINKAIHGLFELMTSDKCSGGTTFTQ